MIPKNPGIAQKGTQKSGSNPQESTQNNGTSMYHDICKFPPLPEGKTTITIKGIQDKDTTNNIKSKNYLKNKTLRWLKRLDIDWYTLL